MTDIAPAPRMTQSAESPVIATGLVKSFRSPDGSTVRPVNGVDFVATAGRITAIVGPSGSGKTTLLQLLAGLDTPDEGTVRLAGVDITRARDSAITKLRRRQVGFVFQSLNLIPGLPARRNIALPIRLDGRRVDTDRLEELAEHLGIRGHLDHTPEQLSGGQKQRVAVARALLADPAIVFADEPTGALDADGAQRLLEVLASTVESLGQTVVLVTHDPTVAAVAAETHVLRDGRLIRQGG